jgi:hypothetical protein
LRAFDRFIGIDWSGAAGEYQAGIQVAQIDTDTKRLQLVRPAGGSHWSRQSVLDFITSVTDQRTLVGFDFAFSLPWNRDLKSLPVCLGGLEGARALWAFIDDFCNNMAFLHAGSIWQSQESPFRPFIKFWSRVSQYQANCSTAVNCEGRKSPRRQAGYGLNRSIGSRATKWAQVALPGCDC